MGLLDNLAMPEKKPSCKVRTILETLDDGDKKILTEALNNTAWKAFTLSDALFKQGIVLDGKLITRHRKGLCSCKAE